LRSRRQTAHVATASTASTAWLSRISLVAHALPFAQKGGCSQSDDQAIERARAEHCHRRRLYLVLEGK
jgi:hypothetical protein